MAIVRLTSMPIRAAALAVLGGGAHGFAGPGAIDEPGQTDQKRDREQDDREVERPEAESCVSSPNHSVRMLYRTILGRNQARRGEWIRALPVDTDVLQDEADTNGGDQWSQPGRVAQTPVDDPVDAPVDAHR